MWLGTRHPRLRCATVWLGISIVTAGAAVLARSGAMAVVARRPAPTLDLALAHVASCALLACAAWLWVTSTVAVAQALRGCPPLRTTGVRRWVLVACGAAVVSLTPPATAAPGHHVPVATTLPYPDRAVAPSRAAGHRAVRAAVVTVRPGDSLWVVARRDLGPRATDAEITTRWQAVYAANRARIGPDPDRIEPGVRLVLPGKDSS